VLALVEQGDIRGFWKIDRSNTEEYGIELYEEEEA